MAEWSRVLSTTIRNYLRDVEVNIMRNRRLLAMLRENGRISYKWSGEQMEWRVQYRRVPMTGYADMDVVTFSRQDRWKIANLDWRGYSIADAMSKKEKLMNKSDEAIIKLYSETTELLVQDIEDAFCEEYYVDGTTAANSKKMHGIESFLATGGSVTVAAGYKAPSQTYAGLKTDLGNYGGTWTGSWPDGVGDTTQSYDFWSPILLDYTHATAWSDGVTWANNCRQVLRVGIIKAQRNKAKKGQLEFILVDDAMYRQLLDKVTGSERIIVDRGEKSKLTYLGFRDVINLDGVDVTWEYGIPAATGYGFNTMQMETRSLQDQLFVNDGPDYDPVTKTWRFAIDFFGNSVWNTKFFPKWKNYT